MIALPNRRAIMKSGPKPRSARERFLESISKQKDGCWIYRGARHRYGQILTDEGTVTTAHRFSYTLHVGTVPAGMFVCHKCDVKGCCNPDHLYAGTHEDNNQDKLDRNRRTGPIGKRIQTHKRYRHGRYMITAQRAELLAEYRAGKFTQQQLAKRYNVCQATVSAIVLGRTNTGDKVRKKRDNSNIRRKLSLDQVQEIKTLYATGDHTQVKLAERFGCTQAHISKIIISEK